MACSNTEEELVGGRGQEGRVSMLQMWLLLVIVTAEPALSLLLLLASMDDVDDPPDVRAELDTPPMGKASSCLGG